MNRRIIGSVFMSGSFALLLGIFIFFSGSGDHARAAIRLPGLATIPPDQSQAQGAPAKPQASALPRVAGTWQDIAPFPNVSIPPTPGTDPLRLKRANAAAYPTNG